MWFFHVIVWRRGWTLLVPLPFSRFLKKNWSAEFEKLHLIYDRHLLSPIMPSINPTIWFLKFISSFSTICATAHGFSKVTKNVLTFDDTCTFEGSSDNCSCGILKSSSIKKQTSINFTLLGFDDTDVSSCQFCIRLLRLAKIHPVHVTITEQVVFSCSGRRYKQIFYPSKVYPQMAVINSE